MPYTCASGNSSPASIHQIPVPMGNFSFLLFQTFPPVADPGNQSSRKFCINSAEYIYIQQTKILPNSQTPEYKRHRAVTGGYYLRDIGRDLSKTIPKILIPGLWWIFSHDSKISTGQKNLLAKSVRSNPFSKRRSGVFQCAKKKKRSIQQVTIASNSRVTSCSPHDSRTSDPPAGLLSLSLSSLSLQLYGKTTGFFLDIPVPKSRMRSGFVPFSGAVYSSPCSARR